MTRWLVYLGHGEGMEKVYVYAKDRYRAMKEAQFLVPGKRAVSAIRVGR